GANLGLRLGAGSLRLAAPAALLPSSGDAPSEEASQATPAEVLAERFPWKTTPPPTPAEVLAERFPADDNASQPPTFSAARMIPAGEGETYDLSALSGKAEVEPRWPAADGNAPTAGSPSGSEPARLEQPKPQRPSARSPNV